MSNVDKAIDEYFNKEYMADIISEIIQDFSMIFYNHSNYIEDKFVQGREYMFSSGSKPDPDLIDFEQYRMMGDIFCEGINVSVFDIGNGLVAVFQDESNLGTEPMAAGFIVTSEEPLNYGSLKQVIFDELERTISTYRNAMMIERKELELEYDSK